MHLAPDTDFLPLTHNKPARDPALSPRQLVPKTGCSPASPKVRPCAEPSTCPVLFSGEASWSTSCSAEAELSSSPSLVALRVSYGQRTVWRYTLLCRRTRVHLHSLGLQILCRGEEKTVRGRKDCFCCSDTTWLCALYVHFDLLSYSHFFRVL